MKHEDKIEQPKVKLPDETDQLMLNVAKYFESGDYWCQNVAFKSDRSGKILSHCLESALFAFRGSHGSYLDAIQRIRNFLGLSPWKWNDRPSRTKQDVINLLRLVAQKHIAEVPPT